MPVNSKFKLKVKTMDIKIRNFQNEDKSCVFRMMREFYNSPAVIHKASDAVLLADIEACISKSPFIEGYVFEKAGEIAGYAMVSKSFSTEAGGLCVWIEDIYLKPEFRGVGIGKEFFQYIEKLYKTAAARLRLEVESSNARAIEVYKKCGYEKLPYIQMIKDF